LSFFLHGTMMIRDARQTPDPLKTVPVDASTPVPDELDARVEQMLAHMDRVHAEVVNRLDGAADEQGAPPDKPSSPAQSPPAPGLDHDVEAALNKVEQAAQASRNGADVPSATIKELDERLASEVNVDAAPPDDDFADGASMVEGMSLDVPLPESSPLGELPKIGPPAAVAPAPAPEPPKPAAPAPAPAAPAPPAPAAKPAAAPPATAKAPAPKPAPAEPVKVVPAKPAGPTLADRFWTVATPVIEPLAVRIGKLPVGFQHTVGWIGIVTLFMAGATWGYVLFFQETRVASHIPLEESSEHADNADAHAPVPSAKGDEPHGEAGTSGKTDHAPQKETAKPAHDAAPADHGEPTPAGH